MPGIDEATALASIIELIETKKYSAIVFDTAPTGHTLKLLQFPELMQTGLNQLSSWQSKLWGYYEMFSGFMGGGKGKKENTSRLKGRLETKLKAYKTGIEKVAKMLKNQKRTTFIPVCIAESLSISETQRLIEQLNAHKIHWSHIVVNQLMDAPSVEEIAKINALESTGNLDSLLLEQIKTTVSLVHSRHLIQSKYLEQLKQANEGKELVQLPLLSQEVTGSKRIAEFSKLLTKRQRHESSDRKAEL